MVRGLRHTWRPCLYDRSFTAFVGWTHAPSSAYYARKTTSIAKTGVTLTRTGIQARCIAVATRCRGCGSIDV